MLWARGSFLGPSKKTNNSMWMKIQSELTSFSWLIFEVGDVGIEPTTRRLRGALGNFAQLPENNNQSNQKIPEATSEDDRVFWTVVESRERKWERGSKE
jgi:hypothetical protein